LFSETDDPVLLAVRAAAREVTGHPERLLAATAHLEDDLGIRPARCLELARLAANALSVPPPTTQDIPATCETLQDLAEILRAPYRERQADLQDFGGDLPLAGKVALVTGSGHGVGKVLSWELSNLGASVVINSFHSKTRGEETTAELVAAGRDAIHVWGSVAQPHHMDIIFDAIRERWGVLDIFVSNASNGIVSTLDMMTVEQWERGYRTNVVGFHQGALRSAALMSRGGKIVSLSTLGAQRCFKFFGCQGSIKAAVETLTRYLAVEFAPKNIQVNTVTIGPIYGEILMQFPEAEANIPELEACTAEGRLCSEQDVARYVTRFLLNPAAAAVNGSCLRLDAGHMAGMPPVAIL
jgi:enoyl-[acyl-carrier protein] reductase III